jgi:hypothetical protein
MVDSPARFGGWPVSGWVMLGLSFVQTGSMRRNRKWLSLPIWPYGIRSLGRNKLYLSIYPAKPRTAPESWREGCESANHI